MNGYGVDHAPASLDQGGFKSLRNPSLAVVHTALEIIGLLAVWPYWACLIHWQLWGRPSNIGQWNLTFRDWVHIL